MSYRSLLVHRCDRYEVTETDVDGAPSYAWTRIKKDEPCRLDLQFIRKGRDPQWTPEAGRVEDRMGVWFGLKNSTVKPGQRIVITKGPAGAFEIDGQLDHVPGRHGDTHHIEAHVTEVAFSVAEGLIS